MTAGSFPVTKVLPENLLMDFHARQGRLKSEFELFKLDFSLKYSLGLRFVVLQEHTGERSSIMDDSSIHIIGNYTL